LYDKGNIPCAAPLTMRQAGIRRGGLILCVVAVQKYPNKKAVSI
jgi:hypothetical protein